MTDDAGGRLRIHAVVDAGLRGRARGVLPGGGGGGSREGGSVRLADREVAYRLVESDETAAAVTEEGAAAGDEVVVLHARVVEALLGARSVVPVPRPLVAGDEEAVLRLLERARVPLREALDYFDGCYEVRLHVRPAGRGPGGPSGPAGSDGSDTEAARAAGRGPAGPAGELFRSLRARARTARRLPATDGRVLTAAFLVPRDGWIGFVEEASRFGERRPEMEIDVTGPWAPYDFVRFDFEGPGEAAG